PTIARIDGGWFRRIAGNEGAIRLLSHLVGELKAQGLTILVEGIETREQLTSALEAGADFFQGFLLSRPQLAGTPVDEEANLTLEKFERRNAEIIALFRER